MDKKKKKKRLIILAVVAGFVLVLMVAAVEYTSHSGFCASCHYMKPFFHSWETSSHADAECSASHGSCAAIGPHGIGDVIGQYSRLGTQIGGVIEPDAAALQACQSKQAD